MLDIHFILKFNQERPHMIWFWVPPGKSRGECGPPAFSKKKKPLLWRPHGHRVHLRQYLETRPERHRIVFGRLQWQDTKDTLQDVLRHFVHFARIFVLWCEVMNAALSLFCADFTSALVSNNLRTFSPFCAWYTLRSYGWGGGQHYYIFSKLYRWLWSTKMEKGLYWSPSRRVGNGSAPPRTWWFKQTVLHLSALKYFVYFGKNVVVSHLIIRVHPRPFWGIDTPPPPRKRRAGSSQEKPAPYWTSTFLRHALQH